MYFIVLYCIVLYFMYAGKMRFDERWVRREEKKGREGKGKEEKAIYVQQPPECTQED